jgi:ATP-dependent Zn protease
MEAATALCCTLLPAIEPVTICTIVPREKHPLGQTVVKANEDRELTGLFTRRYLEEQLLTVLAGRAGEWAGGAGAACAVRPACDSLHASLLI